MLTWSVFRLPHRFAELRIRSCANLGLILFCRGAGYNVGPFLMEGFGLMKSFREIIQNQLLFEGFGIMKSFGDRNKKIADSAS